MAADRGRLTRRTQDVAYVEGEDRVALVRLDAPERPPVLLEGTSALIWGLLDGSRDEAQLAADVGERFGVSAETVAPGVHAFLAGLADLGLLEEAV